MMNAPFDSNVSQRRAAAWDDPVEKAYQMIMPYGKYKGMSLREIKLDDPSYAEWLGTTADSVKNKELREALNTLVTGTKI